jgi:hypothetical protein
VHNLGVRDRSIPNASPALLEMLASTGELDRILSGQGLAFDSPPPQQVTHETPPTSFFIPKPDWDAEERERRERERQAREAELDAELARRQEAALLEEEPSQHPPPTRTAS